MLICLLMRGSAKRSAGASPSSKKFWIEQRARLQKNANSQERMADLSRSTTPRTASWASLLRSSKKKDQILASLTKTEIASLEFCWEFWARPSQLAPPGDWDTWLILAGRGWGKTRTGAEWCRAQVESGTAKRLALVAPTSADARDVMVEGQSGVLAICPPDRRPTYEPSKRRLTWPCGAIATLYSADEPDRLRGPQHDAAWADELAAWRYPEAWDQLQLGLRLGARPRTIVTTTPRPTKIVRALAKSERTALVIGSTYDNRANLAPAFLQAIREQYEGTRLGRQELYAEILDDAPGALWARSTIEQARARQAPAGLERVVVAIDPAATSKASSDETGIVVAARGVDGRGYVLADLSGRYTPDQWARVALRAYTSHRADRIVAEVNNGGEMIGHTIKTLAPNVPYKAIHASRGKRTRAEPIAALYEQGRVSHVGSFPMLEDQMCTWDASDGSPSPDRLDAVVWALSEVMRPAAFRSFGNLPAA